MHNGVLKKWLEKFVNVRLADGRVFDAGAEFLWLDIPRNTSTKNAYIASSQTH